MDDLVKKTEGYAGFDIASLVNDAMGTAWNDMKKNRKPFEEIIETHFIQILKTQLKYIKPLKEVLAKKIEKNREKFGEYKLTKASFNEQFFDVDSRPSASLESRIRVAADPHCPLKYLERLAEDSGREMLLALIGNPEYPFEALACLRNNPDEEVKNEASEKFIRSESGIIEVAKNGASENKMKLSSLLYSLPEAAQEALVEDPDCEVAASLLQYKFLSEPIRKRLVERALKDEALREKIKAHPNCTDEIREKLKKSCANCIYGTVRFNYVYCSKNLRSYDKGYKCSTHIREKNC
jgi:hypothetical protein